MVKKFHGLTSFLSFPEKLLRLPVTLLILGTLDSNIHGKTFMVTKQSAKQQNFFTAKQKQYTVSDVQYIDFILISRYFYSYRTVLKSILHLLMLDNYRTAEFSDNYINRITYQV